jgi:hypothetical protein
MTKLTTEKRKELARVGPRKFSEKYNLNIRAIVRRLNLKPIIRVEAGFFVAYLDDKRYVLCKADAGIRPAVREALQLRQETQTAHEIAS